MRFDDGARPHGWPSRLPVSVVVATIVGLLAASIGAIATRDTDGVVETSAGTESTTTTEAAVADTEPPGITSTTTTSTIASSTTTSTPPATRPRREHPLPGPPAPDPDRPPVCEDLESSFAWVDTGDDSELVAAAGATVAFVETTTNHGDEDCTDGGPACTPPPLLEIDGTPRDSALSLACAGVGIHRTLPPGGSRSDEGRVHLHAPPGRYLVDVQLPDGRRIEVPVRLEDRLPACPLDGITFRSNGHVPGADAFSVDAGPGLFQSVLEPVPTGCTIRITEVVLEIEADGVTEVYRDPDDHWIEAEHGSLLPESRFGRITSPAPGDTLHPARVAMVLENGTLSFERAVRVTDYRSEVPSPRGAES